MRRIALVLAAVFVLSVMVATAAPAMADDNWRGGHNWSWDKDHHKKKKKHHKDRDRHHKHWNPWWWGVNWWDDDDCDWVLFPGWGWWLDCD